QVVKQPSQIRGRARPLRHWSSPPSPSSFAASDLPLLVPDWNEPMIFLISSGDRSSSSFPSVSGAALASSGARLACGTRSGRPDGVNEAVRSAFRGAGLDGAGIAALDGSGGGPESRGTGVTSW